MALLDFLKKKKEIEKARPKGQPVSKKPEKLSATKITAKLEKLVSHAG